MTGLACAMTFFGAGTAQAMPFFEGDQTSVLVTSFFALTDGLGLSVDPIGITAVGPDVATVQSGPYAGENRVLAVFPITGGGINTLTGDIDIAHDGSGLSLSDGTSTVDLENFLIKLDGSPSGDFIGELLATVTVTGALELQADNVPLFDLSTCGPLEGPLACIDTDLSVILNGVRLGLTEGAAQLLNDVFLGGEPAIPAGFQVGVARVDVRVIPEPGTLVLTAVGLIGLGHAGGRRRRRAA